MLVRFGFVLLLLLAVASLVATTTTGSVANSASASRPARRSTTPPDVQEQAVQDLITRLLGARTSALFQLSVVPNSDQNDYYTIATKSVNGITQVTVQASTGVALASGFHWYLKYYCNCSVSWGVDGTGNNLDVPSPLPVLSTPLTMRSPVKYRYYLNVCTHSYSSVWWQWDRWEQEIDWMALHGINLPLSSTGQEFIFAEVFTALGLNETDLESFFVGPAFLAWGRMGNIQGWGGPLDPTWRQAQAALQKRILERQRQFGMLPILPAFAGFVPEGIKRIYPDANLTASAQWAGFSQPYSPTYFLSPLDSLFKTIGRMVVRRTIAEFGTDHVYNADTFNEMPPPSSDPAYLASASRAVYDGIAAEDPQALWVMQGWAFVFDSFWTKDRIRAYLGGVNDTQLLVLDLASDNSPEWSKTDSYFGKDWVWCMLHNGGGVRALYGNLTQYATDPLLALASPNNTMVGVGMTMEAIEQNPVVYELMSEMGWRSEPFDIVEWVQRYAQRRYALPTTNENFLTKQMGQAWELLRQATYEQSRLDAAMFAYTPGVQMGHGGGANATKELEALRLFLFSAMTPGYTPNGPWKYDCVDLTRQVLTNTFNDIYGQIEAAYAAYTGNGTWDVAQFKELSLMLVEVVLDIDTLLATDPNYLLGRWIQGALTWASTPDQQAHYQFNARNQITLWGPDGQIADYAQKMWADLLSTYYMPRWALFYVTLTNAVRDGKKWDPDSYYNALLPYEKGWNQETTTYKTEPQGDTLQTALSLVYKYTDKSNFEAQYEYHANTDAMGPNLMSHTTWSTDVGQLMMLCLQNPLCLGFNTNGWLKADVSTLVPNEPVDLYIRKKN